MEEMIQPVEQNLIFTMVIAMGEQLIPCHVYYARMENDTTFTRVVMNQSDAKAERTIDVDRDEHGWYDMYTGEESPWSQMVAAPLEYYIRQNLNAEESKD